jgi:hypothetical protein
MRIIGLILLSLLMSVTIAAAQITQADVDAQIDTNLASNQAGGVSAAQLRQTMHYMNQAVFQPQPPAPFPPALGVSIDDFGAVHDGVTDDTPALIAAEMALGTGAGWGAGGGYVQLTCTNNYLFATNHQIPPNVIIRHCSPTALVFGDAATGPAGFASQGHINLSATWTLTNVSGVIDAVILNPACTFPATSLACYTGTALKTLDIGGGGPGGTGPHIADATVNAMIVGYKTCFDDTAGGERLNLNIHCDANGATESDAAVIIGNSYDRGTFNITTFPYGTTEQSGSPILARTGIGTHVLPGSVAGMAFTSIFDLGHTTGVQLEGAGGIDINYIWVDTNAGWGVVINGLGGGASIHTMYLYGGGGLHMQNALGDGVHVDYMFCYTAARPANCITADAGRVSIDKFSIDFASAYGLVITGTTAIVDMGVINWKQINGGAAPYLALGFTGATCNQVTIRVRHTDLPPGSSLIGANTCANPTVASAAGLPILADVDLMQVTGNTTINVIQGVWNARQITLEFAGALTVNDKSTSGGNISLAGSTNFTATAGAILVLNYDQGTNLWRQVSSYKP